MKGIHRTCASPRVLVLALAVALVFGAFLEDGAGMAQLNRGSQPLQDLAHWYVDSGYAVIGPMSVVAMNRDTLTLRNPYKDMTLWLRGQTVEVMTPDAQPVSTRAVVTGSNVYVCRKGLETKVILLP